MAAMDRADEAIEDLDIAAEAIWDLRDALDAGDLAVPGQQWDTLMKNARRVITGVHALRKAGKGHVLPPPRPALLKDNPGWCEYRERRKAAEQMALDGVLAVIRGSKPPGE